MAEESALGAGIEMLRSMGFFDILLPFLLVFAIVYGVLERTKLFGEKRHDINAVIALVVGLMVAVTTFVVNVLTGFLPLVGLLAVIIVMFLMLVSMFFGETSEIWANKWFRWIALIVVVVIFAIILIDLLGFTDFFMQASTAAGVAGINIAEWIALIVIVAIIVLIVWMSKAPSSGSSED
jgi:hypothetical protein